MAATTQTIKCTGTMSMSIQQCWHQLHLWLLVLVGSCKGLSAGGGGAGGHAKAATDHIQEALALKQTMAVMPHNSSCSLLNPAAVGSSSRCCWTAALVLWRSTFLSRCVMIYCSWNCPVQGLTRALAVCSAINCRSVSSYCYEHHVYLATFHIIMQHYLHHHPA